MIHVYYLSCKLNVDMRIQFLKHPDIYDILIVMRFNHNKVLMHTSSLKMYKQFSSIDYTICLREIRKAIRLANRIFDLRITKHFCVSRDVYW